MFSVSLFGHVPSCSAWPVLHVWWSCGALCLVSLLPVWTRGALLRRLDPRRCDGEFDMILKGVLHPSSHVHCLSASRHRGTLRLSVVNLAPRWEGGMVGVRNERQTHLPSPPVWTAPLHLRQFGPPLCGPAYRRPPAESSHGSYERSSGFLQKLGRQYLLLLLWPLFDIFKKYIYRIRVFIFPCNSLHT